MGYRGKRALYESFPLYIHSLHACWFGVGGWALLAPHSHSVENTCTATAMDLDPSAQFRTDFPRSACFSGGSKSIGEKWTL